VIARFNPDPDTQKTIFIVNHQRSLGIPGPYPTLWVLASFVIIVGDARRISEGSLPSLALAKKSGE